MHLNRHGFVMEICLTVFSLKLSFLFSAEERRPHNGMLFLLFYISTNYKKKKDIYKLSLKTCKDSDQPAHLYSMIRVGV